MDRIGEAWIGWVRLRYVISGEETFLTHKGMSVKRQVFVIRVQGFQEKSQFGSFWQFTF